MLSIGKIKFNEFPLFLAPLEDITDSGFRRICKQYGADMVFSEFISSEALVRDITKSKNKMTFSEEERPIGIQIFGHDIDSMIKAAEIAEETKADIIDLNFGCPVKKVVKKGAGAALLKDLTKMAKIADAVIKKVNIPVTAKTRLGWDDNNKNIEEAAERLQDVGISLLTIHGRTKNQMYGGSADWTLIGEVKNNQKINIPIIGNGDVTSPEVALEKREKYGVDGIMIGRAAIGNPWLFDEIKQFFETGKYIVNHDIKDRIAVCKKHFLLSLDIKGEKRTIFEMRKHYKGYLKSFSNIKPYRKKLMTLENIEEIFRFFEKIKKIST